MDPIALIPFFLLCFLEVSEDFGLDFPVFEIVTLSVELNATVSKDEDGVVDHHVDGDAG